MTAQVKRPRAARKSTIAIVKEAIASAHADDGLLYKTLSKEVLLDNVITAAGQIFDYGKLLLIDKLAFIKAGSPAHLIPTHSVELTNFNRMTERTFYFQVVTDLHIVKLEEEEIVRDAQKAEIYRVAVDTLIGAGYARYLENVVFYKEISRSGPFEARFCFGEPLWSDLRLAEGILSGYRNTEPKAPKKEVLNVLDKPFAGDTVQFSMRELETPPEANHVEFSLDHDLDVTLQYGDIHFAAGVISRDSISHTVLAEIIIGALRIPVYARINQTPYPFYTSIFNHPAHSLATIAAKITEVIRSQKVATLSNDITLSLVNATFAWK